MFLSRESPRLVGMRPLQLHRRFVGVLLGLLMTVAICMGSAGAALAAPRSHVTSTSILHPLNHQCVGGIHVWGTPSVVSMPNPYSALPEVYAFVEGTNSYTNCATHLYVAHFTGGSGGTWRWEYPPDPQGTTITGYPAAVVYSTSTGYGGAVFATGTNGHLWELDWVRGQYNWGSWIDRGAPVGTYVMGTPAAIALGPQAYYLTVRGTNGRLQFWIDGYGWQPDVGVPPYSTIASDPTETLYLPYSSGMTGNHIFTFVTGANGNIYGAEWLETAGWTWFYYQPPATTAVGRPFTYITPVDGVYYFHVFVQGANGNLEDMVWDGNYWTFPDTTRYPGWPPGYTIGCGTGGAAAPDNVTYSFYACGTDGSEANLVWNGTGWSWHYLGRPSTGMPIISDAGVIGAWENAVSTTSAFVTGGDGRMYITLWAGTPWVNLGTP